MKRFLALVFLSLTLSASAGWLMDDRSTSLAGSEWLVETISGAPVHGEAFLQFRVENQVAGRTGVNQLAGSYRASGERLRFGPIVTTRMAGSPDLMRQEARLLSALEKVDRYQKRGIHLTLMVDGRPVMELRQTDWD